MLTVAVWDGEAWQKHAVTATDHCYDYASLYVEADQWRIIGTTEPGPQPFGTGGEVVMYTSADEGATWKRVKALTRDSQFNHNYPRRPLNAHPDFYALWADGDPFQKSESRLYFATRDGRVFRLPPRIDSEDQMVAPEPWH